MECCLTIALTTYFKIFFTVLLLLINFISFAWYVYITPEPLILPSLSVLTEVRSVATLVDSNGRHIHREQDELLETLWLC